MREKIQGILQAFSIVSIALSIGCATSLDPQHAKWVPAEGATFGRVQTVLIGPTARAYLSELRFIEVYSRTTGDRYCVDVNATDELLFLRLSPGEYEVNRIMIHEGAFQAMANLAPTFRVRGEELNYIGTWRFGMDSPQYGRMVVVSVVSELDQAATEAIARYPGWSWRPILTQLPEPAISDSRLYEVPPYPRIWWFRRHHTS